MQAMDRAYRFGQLRDVSVYRLLGAGSLEELIYARQLYKQQQMNTGYTGQAQTRYFNAVQGDKNRQGELFGVKNIFTLQEEDLATKYTVRRRLPARILMIAHEALARSRKHTRQLWSGRWHICLVIPRATERAM
jgi:hypothetical protein